VYFVQTSHSTTDHLLALPKAVFWPALLVYKLLRDLDR
jgi:hypothetical protein